MCKYIIVHVSGNAFEKQPRVINGPVYTDKKRNEKTDTREEYYAAVISTTTAAGCGVRVYNTRVRSSRLLFDSGVENRETKLQFSPWPRSAGSSEKTARFVYLYTRIVFTADRVGPTPPIAKYSTLSSPAIPTHAQFFRIETSIWKKKNRIRVHLREIQRFWAIVYEPNRASGIINYIVAARYTVFEKSRILDRH